MAADPLLMFALAAAVPLRIAALRERGGPAEADVAAARAFGRTLAEHGDRLLYRGKRPGETAELFNRLAEALAVLAFAPGGVRAFDQHWQADPIPPTESPS